VHCQSGYCNTVITDLLTSPTYCCYITLWKLICCFRISTEGLHWGCTNQQGLLLQTYGLWTVLILVQLTIEYETWWRVICIRCQVKTWTASASAWLTLGLTRRKALWTLLLMNGITDFMQVWMNRKVTLNTSCDV